eukprot:EG_transcript_10913
MNAQPFDPSTSLERRRALEEERKTRILDDKTRSIGVDVDALKEQVAEKKRIREYYKSLDDEYAQQMVQLDTHSCRVDEELKSFRREKEREMNGFRQAHQRKEQRREWDIQDPKADSKALPIRLGDTDPRLGTSSIQVFIGEDVHFDPRKKAMQEQMQQWTEQQVDERDMRKLMEREEQRIWEERDEEMTHKAHEIQKSIDEERRRITTETASFNRSLGDVRKVEEQRSKFREQQANMAEIQLALDSDLLTETKAATLNANDPTRFRIDHMKGLLPHQRQAILDEQHRQRGEMAARREEQAAEKRAWDVMLLRQNRTAVLLDRQRDREKRAKMQQLAEERRAQAEEAAQREQTLRRLYANDVTADFHNRFGSSVR